ncbi:MAG: hypothetical protein B7Z81_14780, partial [Acidocella sp. 20-61-6]
ATALATQLGAQLNVPFNGTLASVQQIGTALNQLPASVIAANLGWQLGVIDRHHTVLLDADLYLGTQSFLFDQPPGPGLRLALEAPERIDTLLAERTARPVDERLHVLAGQERLQQGGLALIALMIAVALYNDIARVLGPFH